ncbi:hypothetical protein GCM10010313_10830 [Streptomyces violarus]|nr:hypothetical protein GCM10010313_10830 [Streptomyces violarus]
MTGLRNGPSRSAWRARAKTRVAYLEAQLEYESVSPRPEERPTLTEGMRGHLERAPTTADEKFGWRSPRSGSTAREGVWSNAIRAVPSPSQALEVLGLYARAVDGALATTVAKVLIDPRSRLVIYSNAGHPPPILLSPDGGCQLLDQATDPPLGARPEHVPRPQAGLSYLRGDALVLYTDGLIERRDEDIDIGLSWLIDALARCGTLPVEELADRLLARMGVPGGGQDDDIALVVVRL